MNNKQLSFEDYEIKILKENVYMLQEQLNAAYIKIKNLTEQLSSKVDNDYWDGSLTYEEWVAKYQQDREA
jgi:hypothetical protein